MSKESDACLDIATRCAFIKGRIYFLGKKIQKPKQESDGEMRVLWSELLRPKAGVPTQLCSHYLAG